MRDQLACRQCLAYVKAPRLQHGYGEVTWILIEDAVRRGLDTRVGLEDTLYLPDGSPARNNADSSPQPAT